MHIVGFIIKKFVTMHGHMDVKKKLSLYFKNAALRVFLLRIFMVLLSHSKKVLCSFLRTDHEHFLHMHLKLSVINFTVQL